MLLNKISNLRYSRLTQESEIGWVLVVSREHIYHWYFLVLDTWREVLNIGIIREESHSFYLHLFEFLCKFIKLISNQSLCLILHCSSIYQHNRISLIIIHLLTEYGSSQSSCCW